MDEGGYVRIAASARWPRDGRERPIEGAMALACACRHAAGAASGVVVVMVEVRHVGVGVLDGSMSMAVCVAAEEFVGVGVVLVVWVVDVGARARARWRRVGGGVHGRSRSERATPDGMRRQKKSQVRRHICRIAPGCDGESACRRESVDPSPLTGRFRQKAFLARGNNPPSVPTISHGFWCPCVTPVSRNRLTIMVYGCAKAGRSVADVAPREGRRQSWRT